MGVHNGCQDLRSGRADLAIAAGVGMILTPATMMPMTALNFLGKDGKCFTFTDKANGYGRGEGVGVVVMKRLDDALRDNDTIRAVIRGSRVNQDGKTPGITMPSSAAQLANIKAVYKEAGLKVDQTAFVECHGTGTPAGDPKESFAISQAFCAKRDADKPILIGSLKPNVGHLEGAAGVAGLIKAVMAVERGEIPRNVYFDPSIGNPDIKFEEWKVKVSLSSPTQARGDVVCLCNPRARLKSNARSSFKVPTELTPWPVDGLRRASVNCFGFGGTNAHVIIDDAGTYLSQRSLSGNHRSVATTVSGGAVDGKRKTFARTQLFLISSQDRDGVARIMEGHAPVIASHASEPYALADYAYTLSRRSSLEYKTFIVARSASDLAAKLSQPGKADIHRVIAEQATVPHLALVFSGQGAQWHAMGRELMEFQPFSDSLVGASKYLSKVMGSGFDLLHELRHEDPATSRIHEPKIAQPATTAIQVALVDLLKASKICPEAVVGHSSGEIAAAYAAGHIEREDAWLIAYQRGQFANLLQMRSPGQKGRMMAVGLSAEQARDYISKAGQDKVVVACENSPISVTLSGDEDQILHLVQTLSADGVFHRLLAVQTAYHSHHMTAVESDYRRSLAGIVPKQNSSGPKMFSSVTGSLVDGLALDGSYWATNLVSPVLFNQAFSAMYKAVKPSFVIEVSPAVTLNRPVQDIMRAVRPSSKKVLPCIPLLKRDQHASITALNALGEVWSRGVPMELAWIWTSKEGLLPQLLVDLPPYPFNHSKEYWFESHLGKSLRFRKNGREDLIGAPVVESTPQDPRWRGFWRLEENPWLADHQVQKATILPAAGLLTMALEAARQCTDSSLAVDVYQITNFNIIKPVIIPAGPHGLEHILSTKCLKVPSLNAAQCSAVYSFCVLTRTENGHWQENADGLFTIFYHSKATSDAKNATSPGEIYHSTYDQLRSDCTHTVNPRQLYERLDGIGMNYGPLFQNVVALSKSQSACTSIVRIPDTKAKMPAQFEFDHLIHPATLDAMFQTVFAIGDTTMVPSYIRQVTFSPNMLRGAGARFHGYATAQMKGYREAHADIVMSDEAFDKPMVVVKGMEFIKIESDASGFLPSNRHLCSEMTWQDLGPVPTYMNGASTVNDGAPVVLLLSDDVSQSTALLIQHLALPNLECVRFSELSEHHMGKLCISLVEIDQALLFDMSSRTFDKLKRLFSLTPGLLWVTTGAQNTVEFPMTAPFHGLARTLRSEDSSKQLISLDISPFQNQDDAMVSTSAIHSVFNWSFVRPDTDEAPEVEYSLRNARLFGARLKPLHALNNVIEKGQDEAVQIETEYLRQVPVPMEIKVGHCTDIGSTYFVPDKSADRDLGPNEVRLWVSHTNLLPIDLEAIMGKGTQCALGFDAIGTVVDVGSDVNDLSDGCLVAVLARNTIRTDIITDRSFVQQLPDRSMIHGLCPSALVTAYHGLHNVGCISSGDTVFVNHAAGPYGDAVLRVSKMIGATVYVGISNESERDFICSNYSIPTGNIIDTTSDRCSEDVMRLTRGSGVDFFFSPLPDQLELGAQCVAENGHVFLVLNANTTVTKATTGIRQDSCFSLHKFDLFAQVQKRPKVFAKAWAEVFDLLITGQLGVCPQQLVLEEPLDYLDDLWTNVSFEPGRQLKTLRMSEASLLRIGKNPLKLASLDPDATYVLIGGLGGLGKSVARLMVDRGARHLLFLSRSGAKTEDDIEFLHSLSVRGVAARALAVDICERAALEQALANTGMPPIKGAIQCAAVIADAVWETMTYEEWSVATRPKMTGSWNLHNTLPQDLDFFVFLSSASGVIGNRGQANYAAGNCFQDALARHRASLGMKNSVSIDLGPVMGAGMLENDEKTCAILKASGFFMVMVEDFLFLVERAMVGCSVADFELPPQVVTGVGTGGLILQNEVSDPYWSETKMFQILNGVDLPQVASDSNNPVTVQSSFSSQSSQGSGRNLVTALKRAESVEDASEFILDGCINYLGVSLSMSPEDIDADKSLIAYGVDSLVTSSFRNWIFKNIGVKITDMEVIGAASIAELATSIAEKGGWGA